MVDDAPAPGFQKGQDNHGPETQNREAGTQP
jgi:hypothetical protein